MISRRRVAVYTGCLIKENSTEASISVHKIHQYLRKYPGFVYILGMMFGVVQAR